MLKRSKEINKWHTYEGVKYRVIPKCDSWLMKLIGKLLFFNKSFMTGYVTTIGKTIYTSSETGYITPTTFAHELVHIQQYNRWKWLFSLSYLLVLPAGLTFRAYWEMQASAVSIKLHYESTPHYTKTIYRDKMLKRFTGPDYLYMCIFPKMVEKWFDGVIDEIENKVYY